MTSQLLLEGHARPRGKGLRLPHLLRFPLPQLQHLFHLFHLHPHLFFQLLYLQDNQIFYLLRRCFTPWCRVYTEGSPSSWRAFRAWACPPLWAWRSLRLRWPGQDTSPLLLERVEPLQPRSLIPKTELTFQIERSSPATAPNTCSNSASAPDRASSIKW